jgi:hypothetical protein
MVPALASCTRRFSPLRLLAALLLLAAAFQAATPGWSPLEPTRGSAFSASTADVALAPTRSTEAARIAPHPAPPLADAVAPQPIPGRNAALPQFAARPDSTGPPATRPRAALPEPRAPPLA